MGKRILDRSVFLLVLSVTAVAWAQSMPDWNQARDETVKMLSEMVKIDSSNGNETSVAEYIKSVLGREDLESDIFERVPGRGNIVARLKGNGKKKPILLMGHLDVVGVEKPKWTVDPFGGIVKEGYVWGRGSSDDKGMVAACLEAFLQLHRLKVPLDRDVIFLAEAGEEGTPSLGIEYMIDRHWDKIECEYALNEGGGTLRRDGKVLYVGIATTEKVPRGMELVARGTSGHGSMPRPDNPIVHLAAAVAKVGNYQPPMRLNETTRAFFQRLAAISPPDEARLYAALGVPGESAAAQEQLRLTNIQYNSMLRTSISPTIISGGFRSNVIPAEARATLDVRALPDEDIPALMTTLTRLIDDPAVQVVAPQSGGRPATAPSSIATELFHAMEDVQTKVYPGAATLPLMVTGATDSAQLRVKGVQAYGLGAAATEDDRSRVHGNDERNSVEGLGRLTEFIYRSVAAVAAAK